MSGEPTVQATRYLAERLSADFGFYLSDRRLLDQRQSAWQHIEVFENPQFGRVMRIDGCFMTSERDEFFYHEPMVHLPAIAHPGVRRVKLRVSLGGHDVPADVVRRRFARSQTNFFALYAPLADDWALFDNSQAGDARLIAELRNQHLQIEDMPSWTRLQPKNRPPT